jgi:glucose-6-phosphate 1-dehydrogenase
MPRPQDLHSRSSPALRSPWLSHPAATGPASRRVRERAVRLATVVGLALVLAAPRQALAVVEPNTTFVILGVGGDVSTRKVLPSLMKLSREGLLARGTRLVGLGTSEASHQEMAGTLRERIAARAAGPLDEGAWSKLSTGFRYSAGDVTQPATFHRLAATLKQLDAERGGSGPRIIMLALPPSLFPAALKGLQDAGLLDRDGPEVRLVVEKPFGTDLASAQKLGQLVNDFVGEDRVYRIDHYLGKEAVNLFVDLRTRDRRFRPAWNNRFIERVDVRAREKIGVEGRGAFFEETGTLRDMVQSHLLQLVALTGMSAGTARSSGLGQAKLRALQSIKRVNSWDVGEHAVRGQYEGYADEVEVANSTTETYVDVRTRFASGPLRGVGIGLQSGKGLDEKVTDIRVKFRALPRSLALALGVPHNRPATLTVGIDPDPVIELRSGSVTRVLARGQQQRDPYAQLLGDVAQGERSRFVDQRQVETTMRFVDAIHAAWGKSRTPMRSYPRGSPGPPVPRTVPGPPSRITTR